MMIKGIICLLICLPILGLPAFGQQKTKSSVITIQVETTNGILEGISSAENIKIFKGIPFAQPPIGKLRWKSPQRVASWTGIRKADKFGPSAMQAPAIPFSVYTTEFLIPKEPISEDCLYLNLWTGAKSSEEKRPVIVWIHGGGYTSGGSAVPIYDGESLAKKGVVFVSINYRLGIFGFFSHPDLRNESPKSVSGNYGFQDQVAALKWVQKNIAAFGGDPDNITIAGQSAGAMSVSCLVASPVSKGLFHKAIAESGALVLPIPQARIVPMENAEELGIIIATNFNATSLRDLRNVPAIELLQKARGSFLPVIDGYFFPESIPELFAKEKEADVPLLTGWNADDGFPFNFKNKDLYQKQAQENYGSDVSTFLKYYPGSTDDEARASHAALARDQVFGLNNLKWAEYQSKRKHDVYVYYFTHKPPSTPELASFGAFHIAEVPYFLGDLKFLNRSLTSVDYALSEAMASYYVNFAKTGNPNGEGLPTWEKYTAKDNKVMILKENPETQRLPTIDGMYFLLSK